VSEEIEWKHGHLALKLAPKLREIVALHLLKHRDFVSESITCGMRCGIYNIFIHQANLDLPAIKLCGAAVNGTGAGWLCNRPEVLKTSDKIAIWIAHNVVGLSQIPPQANRA